MSSGTPAREFIAFLLDKVVPDRYTGPLLVDRMPYWVGLSRRFEPNGRGLLLHARSEDRFWAGAYVVAQK